MLTRTTKSFALMSGNRSQTKMNLKASVIIFVFIAVFRSCSAWGSSHQKVKLTDIQTLTLKAGQMTTGRRNSPIPQLSCVGGTAAHLFKPQVVQCYNRGSDGYDVQWECKTDMDNAYRFGTVEVVCEGYDHPDDKYILKGSCALEYMLDLTKEGFQQQQQRSGHHDYYGGQANKEPAYETSRSDYKRKSGTGDFIIILVVGVVIYAIYKTCIRMPSSADGTGSDIPPDHRGTGWFGGGGGGGGGGPAPGFRPEYMPDDSCSGTSRRASSGSGGGGFWSGAATGGILGYMLGNRGNQGTTGYGFREPPPAYSSHHAFGGTGSSSSYSGGSTGTRSASGFGGTRRR